MNNHELYNLFSSYKLKWLLIKNRLVRSVMELWMGNPGGFVREDKFK